MLILNSYCRLTYLYNEARKSTSSVLNMSDELESMITLLNNSRAMEINAKKRIN